MLVGWGNYPKHKSKVFKLRDTGSLKEFIKSSKDMIAYGNGRSYGDSAISDNIIPYPKI